jgi:hypothetical protein
MRTRSIFLSLGLLLLTLPAAYGQREETVLGERGWGFSGFWADWNHQLTQYNQTNSYLTGWQFNFEFGKSLQLGFGNYYLLDDIEWSLAPNPPELFKMRYQAFRLGYSVKSYKSIHPVFKVDFGPGKVELGDATDRVFVIQPAAGIEINVLRWFRIGLDGGYRIVSNNNLPGLSDQELSGLFGQASFKFGFSWGRYRKRPADKKDNDPDERD